VGGTHRGPRTAGGSIARGDGAAGGPTGGVVGDAAAGHDDRGTGGTVRRSAGDAAGERRIRSHDDRHDRGGRERRSRGTHGPAAGNRGRPRRVGGSDRSGYGVPASPCTVPSPGVSSVLHRSATRVTFAS
jgi:hypothetical protein